MGRTVILDDKVVQQHVNAILNIGVNAFELGLLIGQLNTSKDLVFGLVPTPKQEITAVAESQATTRVPITFANLDGYWVSAHAKQISRMLSGGIDVLGIYVISPSEVYKKHEAQVQQLIASVYKSTLLGVDSNINNNNINQSEKELRSCFPDTPINTCKERLVLHIDSKSRKYACKSYDMSRMNYITNRSAEIKFQSLVVGSVYPPPLPSSSPSSPSAQQQQINPMNIGSFHIFSTTYSMDPITIHIDSTSSTPPLSIQSQIQRALFPLFGAINSSIITIDEVLLSSDYNNNPNNAGNDDDVDDNNHNHNHPLEDDRSNVFELSLEKYFNVSSSSSSNKKKQQQQQHHHQSVTTTGTTTTTTTSDDPIHLLHHRVELYQSAPFRTAFTPNITDHVTAVVSLQGSIHSKTFVHVKESMDVAVKMIKMDIIKSILSRLDLLQEDQEAQEKEFNMYLSSLPPPASMVSSIPHQITFRLPKRVYFPLFLAGGGTDNNNNNNSSFAASIIESCDYVQPEESILEDCASRIVEMFGLVQSNDHDNDQKAASSMIPFITGCEEHSPIEIGLLNNHIPKSTSTTTTASATTTHTINASNKTSQGAKQQQQQQHISNAGASSSLPIPLMLLAAILLFLAVYIGFLKN